MTPTRDPYGDALALLSILVVDDHGATWGQRATDHQWADARAILDPHPAQPNDFLTRPRGGSKTDDAAAFLICVGVVPGQVPPGSTLYAAASDQDQAALLIDSIRAFAARTRALKGALVINRFEVTFPSTGVSLRILAADTAGAYGLRPAFLVVDEIAQWSTTPRTRELWTALYSATGKVPHCRVVVMTSAGDPVHWAGDLYRHAEADRRWRVSAMPGPVPWADRSWLAEQKRQLLPSVYDRLHNNLWVASEDRLADFDQIRACVTRDGPSGYDERHRYAIGVDIGIKKDRTAIAVVHSERSLYVASGDPDDAAEYESHGLRIVLDRLIVLEGTKRRPVQLDEVEELIVQAAVSYGGRRTKVVLDPWQGVGIQQRLVKVHRLRAEEFTISTASGAHLAGVLHNAIHGGGLSIYDHPGLVDELANIRLRETGPNTFKLDHDPGRHNDMAFSIALAAQELLRSGPPAVARSRKMLDTRDAGRGRGTSATAAREHQRQVAYYESKGVKFAHRRTADLPGWGRR